MSSVKREITISPTTRIEGHGKVSILLDDNGDVADAFFYATEIRGFEYFLRGMEAERLPFIISRICGVCSTAHVLASVKAIESIFEAQVTETALKLRELLLMAQIISNHALVFFFLTLPDFWFPTEEDASRRNIFQIMRENPEIGRKAVALRRFAANLLEVIGKRDVHIVSIIPGGSIDALKEGERVKLLAQSEAACSIVADAFETGKALFEKNWNDFRTVGDYKTYYMALTRDDALEFYDGKIRVVNPSGGVHSEFTAQSYMDMFEEKAYEWTYAKFAYLKNLNAPQNIVQTGPTARMNVNNAATTTAADKELAEFKRRFGSPAHATLLYDYARLIDLTYACERARQLLEDETLTRTDVRVKIEPKAGRGVGVVEAPRGTLAHEYILNRDGHLKRMRLMIPTQVNNAAINLNLKDAAKDFIRKGEVKPGLLNKIEMVVRAYDPCIKCATRVFGEDLMVEIRNRKGEIITVLRK